MFGKLRGLQPSSGMRRTLLICADVQSLYRQRRRLPGESGLAEPRCQFEHGTAVCQVVL